MDPEIKLLVFAALLVLATGVIWWRLVTLILRGRFPKGPAASAKSAGDLSRSLPRAAPTGDRASKS